MKRLLSLCLTLLLSLSVFPAIGFSAEPEGSLGNFRRTETYAGFSDVPADAWYYENVIAVCEYGLMVGKSDSVFDPDAPVTIAEAVTIAARLRKLFYTGSADFEATDPWFKVYMKYADENGFTGGFHFFRDDGSLPLNRGREDSEYAYAKADRAAFARIVSDALPDAAFAVIGEVEDASIPDISLYENHEDRAAVYRLYRAGILTGSDAEGRFRPSSEISRAEVAAVVTRIADESLRKPLRLKSLFTGSLHPELAEIRAALDFVTGTPSNLWAYCSGDFDGDGSDEAFVVYGRGPSEVWFVSRGRADRLVKSPYLISWAASDAMDMIGPTEREIPWDDFGSARFCHVNQTETFMFGYLMWKVEDSSPVPVLLPVYDDVYGNYRFVSFLPELPGYAVDAYSTAPARAGTVILARNYDYRTKLMEYNPDTGTFEWTKTLNGDGEWVPRG